MIRDRGQSKVERPREFPHRGLAVRQACENRSPRRVSESRKGSVEQVRSIHLASCLAGWLIRYLAKQNCQDHTTETLGSTTTIAVHVHLLRSFSGGRFRSSLFAHSRHFGCCMANGELAMCSAQWRTVPSRGSQSPDWLPWWCGDKVHKSITESWNNRSAPPL